MVTSLPNLSCTQRQGQAAIGQGDAILAQPMVYALARRDQAPALGQGGSPHPGHARQGGPAQRPDA